jgi:hypothetical protein
MIKEITMRGIKLRHGVAFVEHDGVTVRIRADGTCELSPVQLPVLEWDLRTEPPESWTYITEAELDDYGQKTRQKILDIVTEFNRF